MTSGDSTDSGPSRRTFLKAAGIAGMAGLAGCTGGDGGDGGGGSGGDGGSGDGSGGDGGGGSTPTKSKPKKITITNFPINVPGVVWEYLDGKTNILADELEAAGYVHERKASFEGPSLFFSGKAQIATDLNTIEAARASVSRDVDLRILDRSQNTFLGLITKANGDYDPEQTGGVEQSFKNLLEDQGRVGIFGWGVGDVPAYQIAASRLTDGEFTSEGDYNVVTSDASAIPTLIDDGKLVAGASSPSHGAGELMMNGDLAPLMYPADFFAQQDWGTPSLENAVVKADFLESDRAACEALVRAWDKGTDWFFDKGIDEIPGDSDLMPKLGTEKPKVSEYTINWLLGEDVKWQFDTDTPKVFKDVYLNDEWVAENKKFLDNAAEINQVPSNWEERVEYVTDIEP